MNRVFITGMGRSGTTLLDKLLSNHQSIEILSQPFPLFFTEIKKAFLNQRGIKRYYVLNDNVYSGDYELEEFNRFIASYELKHDKLKELFEKMKNYSGQMTKIDFSVSDKESFTLLEAFDILLKNNLQKKNIEYFGAKEIMCDEFIPYLLQNDTKLVVIVRDPRDVVASINYPKKEKYLGDKKPTLFILRGWRRTIDYFKMLQSNKNIFYVKYEDLVIEPYKQLNKITNFLDTTPFENNHFDNGILDRNGRIWKANTSFDIQTSFISSQSIGGYKNVLSSDEICYIESVCKDEMKLMGYALDTTPSKEIIQSFKDYGIEESEHLDKNFSSLKENIRQEIYRYEKYSN